jgi:hypothetical protein
MKTTVELPADTLRRAKALAARQGTSLKTLLTEALDAKLREEEGKPEKPWMKGFGALSHLKAENKKVMAVIEKEFGQVDEQGWEK